MKQRVIRQSLIDATRAFVTNMLINVMKQSADKTLIDQVTEKVLKALPPSVRYSELGE